MLFIIKGSEGDYDSYFEYVKFACEILDEGVKVQKIEEAFHDHTLKLMIDNGININLPRSRMTAADKKLMNKIYKENTIIEFVKSHYNVRVFDNFYEQLM